MIVISFIGHLLFTALGGFAGYVVIKTWQERIDANVYRAAIVELVRLKRQLEADTREWTSTKGNAALVSGVSMAIARLKRQGESVE